LGQKGSILFLEILNLYFLADEYEAAMGGGGREAPRLWRGNAPKKTDARSARARTRGKNPLVLNKECMMYVCNVQ
jgi:hypothetical protein